jgi:LysM repeat protein
MSAMRAEELPAVPAASPQDSAQSRAAARWSRPDLAAPDATAPGQAGRPTPARDQAAHSQSAPSPAAGSRPARSPAAGSRPSRGQQAPVPLRLTRRGRVVAAVAAALLLAALSLVIAASAQAASHPVPRSSQQDLTQVIVGPGQSLWSVAENADPGADTRAVIQQIIELNGLTSDDVFAGQRLWVPRG